MKSKEQIVGRSTNNSLKTPIIEPSINRQAKAIRIRSASVTTRLVEQNTIDTMAEQLRNEILELRQALQLLIQNQAEQQTAYNEQQTAFNETMQQLRSQIQQLNANQQRIDPIAKHQTG